MVVIECFKGFCLFVSGKNALGLGVVNHYVQDFKAILGFL